MMMFIIVLTVGLGIGEPAQKPRAAVSIGDPLPAPASLPLPRIPDIVVPMPLPVIPSPPAPKPSAVPVAGPKEVSSLGPAKKQAEKTEEPSRPRYWIHLSNEPGIRALGRIEGGYAVDIIRREPIPGYRAALPLKLK